MSPEAVSRDEGADEDPSERLQFELNIIHDRWLHERT